jgi:hypothetical protein
MLSSSYNFNVGTDPPSLCPYSSPYSCVSLHEFYLEESFVNETEAFRMDLIKSYLFDVKDKKVDKFGSGNNVFSSLLSTGTETNYNKKVDKFSSGNNAFLSSLNSGTETNYKNNDGIFARLPNRVFNEQTCLLLDKEREKNYRKKYNISDNVEIGRANIKNSLKNKVQNHKLN